jgi:uncharacterized protein YndB with AHSA1/START domain
MPAMGDRTSVEHEIRVAARPETVFAYFTDPARLVSWMGVDATLDPRPGGVCRITMNDAATMLGEFVEVDPYRRIVWTWGWEQAVFAVPPQSTEVEVSFTPDGDDTIVRLAHRRLPAHGTAFHRAGWRHYLPRLAAAAAGADPGPDAWADVAAATRDVGDLVPGARR